MDRCICACDLLFYVTIPVLQVTLGDKAAGRGPKSGPSDVGPRKTRAERGGEPCFHMLVELKSKTECVLYK